MTSKKNFVSLTVSNAEDQHGCNLTRNPSVLCWGQLANGRVQL